jgi:membrane protein implicated in regulation of membrane protease activity
MMQFGWELWLVIGLVCIALDMIAGLEFFVLSFGIGALVTSGIVASEQFAVMATGHWKAQLLAASLIGLAITFPIRNAVKKSMPSDDINHF